MFDLATIKHMNSEAGLRASEEFKRPQVLTADNFIELDNDNIEPIRTIPDLGDYEPDNWNRFDLGAIKNQFTYSYKIYSGDNEGFGAFFVDAAGFGGDDEAALTIPQFITSLKELYEINASLGIAIVETGQFQVKIGVFQEAA